MTTTSHLVCLFCVTAGQNGENLGSDEEQIVLFVYLLHDIANNKVGVYRTASLIDASTISLRHMRVITVYVTTHKNLLYGITRFLVCIRASTAMAGG